MARIGKAPEREAFGITVFGSKHPMVTELLDEGPPSIHGETTMAGTRTPYCWRSGYTSSSTALGGLTWS